jgi:hypothetical protein
VVAEFLHYYFVLSLSFLVVFDLLATHESDVGSFILLIIQFVFALREYGKHRWYKDYEEIELRA